MTTFLKTTALSTHGAVTLPQACYVSPALFAAEQERIFAGRWLCIGREEQVAQPGQFVVVNIGRDSLIVVRDRADTVRALYNVCRHRGTRLCEAASGKLAGSIQCPYHAWTYGLDGRLIGVPDQRGWRASTRRTTRCCRRTSRSGKGSCSSTWRRIRSRSMRPSRR